MKTLKVLDDDIQLKIIEGDEELLQSIERTLTTRLGEWFLNTEYGLDYEPIIQKQFDIDRIELAVREAILQESRVLEVISVTVEVNRETRKADIKFIARTENAQVESEVVV